MITALTQSLDTKKTTQENFLEIQRALQNTVEKFEKLGKPRRKPWCSPKLAKQIRKQHKLHKRRIAQPTSENIKKHRAYRQQLNKTIKQEKKQHIEQELEKHKNDSKQQAKILKTLIPSKSKPRTSPTEIIYEKETHTEPQKIADSLNDFFITIGHKTSQKIPQNLPEEKIAPDPPTTPPFELQAVTVLDVQKVMKALNPNKAADIYKISPAFLKDLIPFLAPHLTWLFNQAIQEGYYPDALKITKVIEIYNAKETNLPSNYRPISLLPIIAKILDSLLNTQIMQYLLEEKLISPTQYAFRPHSSTNTALQTIINNISKHRSQKQPTVAIYIDLSKAYDTVSHKLLLQKLKRNFNFSEHTVNFIASYFQNRMQTTHTQHAQSSFQKITHGIPQGSTLSTTFFLIYINDILKTVPSSKVYTYADDTTLIVTAPTLQTLQTLAQSELSSLINYFYSNNLVPNATKTVYSLFYPRTPQQLNLLVNNIPLDQEHKSKLLGVYMQNNLKHYATIAHIIKKLQPTMQSFKYATKFLPTSRMLSLYYEQVYPHFLYAITIWGSPDPKKTYLQPLIRTQKRIVRLIKNVPPRTHTKPIMAELGILSITNIYKLRASTEQHPFIYPSAELNRPDHIHHYIYASEIHEHKTRYAEQRHQYIPNPCQYSKTRQPHHTMDELTRQYSKSWNELPLTIRQVSNIRTFKTMLKAHLLEIQSNAI